MVVSKIKSGDIIPNYLKACELFSEEPKKGCPRERQIKNWESNVNTGGAYVHVSYFLTGETRVFERFGQHGAQFGRNVPFTNFFMVPGGVGSGAWELKARWSYFDFDSLNKGQYNDLTVGFNWYWSDRTRVMFDWIHPVTSTQTTFGATTSNILGIRFDFNW